MRKRLLLFVPEQKLPSYRHLLKEYSCSRQTLTKVMDRLIQEGACYSEARKGYFAAKRKGTSNGPKRILFVRVDWVCEHANRISEVLAEECKRRHFIFSEVRYLPERATKSLLALEKMSCDAAILWLERVDAKVLLKQLELPFPIILFDSGITFSNVPIVDLQEELAGMMAARYFYEHGHRKIALLITEPPCLTRFKQINGFCDELALYGISPKTIDCNIYSGESSLQHSCDFLAEYFNTEPIDFTAAFVLSSISQDFIKLFENFGRKVPQNLSLIGCQNPNHPTIPPIPKIVFDENLIGQKLLDAIEQMFHGKSFDFLRIPPKFIER